jgi:tetratricopeptide (TPR) repeat protein
MAGSSASPGVARAANALLAGDIAAALREAHAADAQITADPECAAAFLDVLRAAPVPEVLRWVERVLSRHPEHAQVVTRACDALIRAAERVPPDEPQPPGGAARRAADAAARCLRALAARAPGDEPLLGFLHMSHANALRLLRAYDDALAACRTALAIDPERGTWWFNLGLLHKARGEWAEALDVNRRARALLGDEKPVLFNIAIAATALGRGDDAAEALRRLGLDAQVAPSGMPWVEGLPPAQVRAATLGSGLNPRDSAVPDRSVGFELLWVTPISPCHGVVSSASQRDASVDYGDVVLWDPVPVGVTDHAGKPVPRFPLLAVLRRGDERRFRFVALQQDEGAVAAFGEALPDEAQLFIHHERIERLCARCASGEHMQKHAHEPEEEHRLVYGKLIVPGGVDLHAFRRELDARLHASPSIQLIVPALLEALGDTEAAGKAHQLWRGLSRTGLKLEATARGKQN